MLTYAIGILILVIVAASEKSNTQTTGTACTGDLISCSGVCKNLDTDNSNCGQCGDACSSSQYCLNGVCTNSNKANCGSLGGACALGQYCWLNVCRACKPQATCVHNNQTCSEDGNTCTCGNGLTYNPADYLCYDLQTDILNCGEIGHTCTGFACLQGLCSNDTCANGYHIVVSVDSSNTCELDSISNCGAHSNACPEHSSCQNGICVCDTGYSADSGGNCNLDNPS